MEFWNVYYTVLKGSKEAHQPGDLPLTDMENITFCDMLIVDTRSDKMCLLADRAE